MRNFVTGGIMARGSKKAYTDKQKREARHIEQGAKKRGYSAKRAAQIGWATVNKQDHGGKKTGSGRGKKSNHDSARRGGERSHASRGGSHLDHVRAGRKGGKASAKSRR
jgi:hypothetical protein